MPSDIENLIRVGNDLLGQDRPDEAVACYEQALHHDPRHAEAQCNLISALRAQARLDEAIACGQQALAINPDCVPIHDNLLFTLHFSAAHDAADIYEESRRWNLRHAAPLAPSIQRYPNDRTPDRRLKIGYVSPDFCSHVQALFLLPLLAAHDRRQFEIFGYSNVAAPDFVTNRMQSLTNNWRDISALADEQVAALVRQDEIDILVDLTMHMERNRLLAFARKPAPVQVTWLAYPGTTGLTAIDYRLTDPHLDPSELFDRHYSEASIRLPDTFWCYDPISLLALNDLPALTTGHVTFGSLNNFCKVNANVLRLWAQVLDQVAGSRLILLAPAGQSRQSVIDIFQQQGVAAERITFVGRQSRGQYLQSYHDIDIGLDTFPSNGHTTSLDALWMGVPVVTLLGGTAVGRAGYSQLSNLGLTSLVGQTSDDFVRIACQLAGNLRSLSQLRASLRARMERSPLMDARRFARNLEAAYRQMWQRWIIGR